jgi:tetratricopeptide (TPR) repeat protein
MVNVIILQLIHCMAHKNLLIRAFIIVCSISSISILNELMHNNGTSIVAVAQIKNQNKGLQFVAQNVTSKAKEYYDSAMNKSDKHRDYQGALADINKAIQIDPNNSLFYNYRVTLKVEKLGDFRGALMDLDKIIQLDPKNSVAYSGRGWLRKNYLHDPNGALADYNKSIQLNPQNAIAYSNRAILRSNDFRDYKGALADLNRHIQIEPNEPLAYGARAVLKHDLLNDKPGGIADIERAARLAKQKGNMKPYQDAIALLKKWKKSN